MTEGYETQEEPAVQEEDGVIPLTDTEQEVCDMATD